MELYVFDKDLNFQGILESFFSLRWIRKYSRYGEFELHCGLTSEILELLKKDYIIWKKDDLEAGYIEYRNIRQEADGKEVLVVKGKFLTGHLDRRIIWGTEIINDTAENAIRTLINNNAISPTNVDRIIPMLQLGTLKNYTQITDKQTSYRNLLEEVEIIALTSELGIRTLIDIASKQMVFDIYKGIDRTAGQTINVPAIFSKEFENILEQEYTDSLNNYRNLALVGGIGEGTARKLITVGSGIGLDRLEVFSDQKSLSNEVDGVVMSDAEYNALLIEKGNEKLSEYKGIQTFDSKINLKSNLIYKTDFDLGDIVTCISKKWGVTIDTRITEVEEIYEESGLSVNVTFGNNVPTLIDKIKQVVR